MSSASSSAPVEGGGTGLPRRVVVTGGASAVGRACATLFAGAGADVLLVDHRADDLGAAAPDAAGPKVQTLVAEAWTESGAREVREACQAGLGGLDCLVSCAGFLDDEGLAGTTRAEWTALLDRNVVGPAFLARELHALLRRSEAASVVLVGSIDGLHGNARYPAYSAGNGALLVVNHLLGSEWATDGVRVNLVATALVSHQAPEGSDGDVAGVAGLVRATPLGRAPSAAEVASTVAFLASRSASYVTGTVVRLDGGRLAATPGTGGQP